ncbi:hypothetical protein ACHWQZ_G018872 [Mnemiopsis leidyi]
MIEQLGLQSVHFVYVSQAQDAPSQEYHPETIKYRFQLAHHGKCLGSSNNSNVDVVYCDPTQNHMFYFLGDSRVGFDRTGECLMFQDSNPRLGAVLNLGACSQAATFNLVNNSIIQLADKQQTIPLCVAPIKPTNVATTDPDLGDQVGLTLCQEIASHLNLIEETDFQVRRRALLVPPLNETNDYCDYPACGINKGAPPVVALPPEEVERCYNLSSCVTVVIKTARRPQLVLRLARSIRSVKGYDLPVIAYDDGVEPHAEEVMREFRDFPNLQYIVGEEEDLGIALGRTLAVQLVKTKYFLLFDDDTVLNNDTDIERLVDILDTTDASLVGGKVAGYKHFAGFLKFTGNNKGHRVLFHYNGGCFHKNETLAEFPDCMRCDTTTNVFLAKTADVLEVGGWSKELKIMEHKDLFLRLKAAQKKVVYCPKFTINNKREGPKKSVESGFKHLRRDRQTQMRKMFANIWNVNRCSEVSGKKFISQKVSTNSTDSSPLTL